MNPALRDQVEILDRHVQVLDALHVGEDCTPRHALRLGVRVAAAVTRDSHAVDLRFIDCRVDFLLRIGRRYLDVVEPSLVHLPHAFAETIGAAGEVGPAGPVAAGRRDELADGMQAQRVDVAQSLRCLQRLHRLDHAGDVTHGRHARIDVQVHEMQPAQRREAVRRLRVARIDEMHVHVHESGQHILPRSVVALRVSGNIYRARGPCRDDAIVADENGRIRYRLATVAIDQRAAGDRDGRGGRHAAECDQRQHRRQQQFHKVSLRSGIHTRLHVPFRGAASARSPPWRACRRKRLPGRERAGRRTARLSSRRRSSTPSALGSAH